ncbi:AMP-binding enzyme [Sporomusa malonica]|uniref:AMP-binding enzyme n=1 Tax=Sporomusa malonica TaxID=112901 RepID=A0A1W2F6E1_9FIRM|nr:AMP-binding enzyme [Sporomusa malonica]
MCSSFLKMARFVENDTTLTVAPLFHIAGLAILTLPILFKGGTVIIEDEFKATEVLGYITDKKVTCLFLVPFMWLMLVQLPGFYQRDLSVLRFGISAGSKCTSHINGKLQEKGIPFFRGIRYDRSGSGCHDGYL